MKRYIVVFEFYNEYGELRTANYTNNGRGFILYEDALEVAVQLRTHDNVRYVNIEEM